MQAEATLPGIYFQAEAPPLGDALPRMDIAAFVGFAAKGPVHTPVSIEDETQYSEVFGDDLGLAWDPEAGRVQYALLGPTVRAFFRAGGQRCWVVRVAGSHPGGPQWFPLPAVAGLAGSDLTPAYLMAGSAGSWADSIALQAEVARESLGITAGAIKLGSPSEANYRFTVGERSDRPLAKGDMLRLIYAPGGSPERNGGVCFLPVSQIEHVSTPEGPAARIVGDQLICMRGVESDCLPHRILVTRRGDPSKNDWVPVTAVIGSSAALSEEFRVRLKCQEGAAIPQPGMAIPVEWTGDAGEDPPRLGFVVVRAVNYQNTEDSGLIVDLTMQRNQAYQIVEHQQLDVVLDQSPYVERVTMTITAQEPMAEATLSLGGLGFVVDHSRCWTKLPADNQVYRSPDEPQPEDKTHLWSALFEEAKSPRFPFAAPTPGSETVWLPLAFGPLTTVAAGDTDADTAIERDGLAVPADTLLLDDRLKDSSAATLEQDATMRRYLSGERLSGIHSLFFLDEPTLLAVPDAVHRRWKKTENLEDLQTWQVLEPPDIPSLPPDWIELSEETSWSGVEGADGYLLQLARDPEFFDVVSEYVIDQCHLSLSIDAGCDNLFFVRVRAKSGSRQSPWSNTRKVRNTANGFKPVKTLVPDPPQLSIEAAQQGVFKRLAWGEVAGATRYLLQASADAGLFQATIVYEGALTHYDIAPPEVRLHYYRLRAECKTSDGVIAGPWSNTVWIAPLFKSTWQIVSVDEYDPEQLLRIHERLLRMAAVRGDLVATMCVPAHFEGARLLEYKDRLAESVRASMGGADPSRMLSYGAMFHPWLSGAETNIDFYPPDGAACGIIARRTIERGPWVAPANVVLPDVVAIEPLLQDEEWIRVYQAQVNLIRPDVQGFVVYSADTLSPSEALKSLSVRRLLILLRRLALREGDRLVFESNGINARRLARRVFESVLSDLYQRGAFSGETIAEAFRVVVDQSNNQQQSLDQGRLHVDLQVAPSEPMKFLTVRLIQNAGESRRVLEV